MNVDWIQVGQERVYWWDRIKIVTNFWASIKNREI